MPTKKPTYEQAIERLEEIVNGLEENTLELDKLTSQLAEAQQLIKFCKEKLQKAENDVNKILSDEQE